MLEVWLTILKNNANLNLRCDLLVTKHDSYSKKNDLNLIKSQIYNA